MRMHTLVLAMAMMAVMVLGAADAAEHRVDDDWMGADFSSIQDAINASTDGDTILVHAGNYPGDLFVNRSVSIIGNGTSVTTVEGEHDGPTVEVANQSARLSGITFTTGDSNEAVIDVWRNFVVIDNCSIVDFSGFGIRAYDRTTIDNCTIDNGPVAISINNDDLVVVKWTTLANISYHCVELYYSQWVSIVNTTLDSFGIEMVGSAIADFSSHDIDNVTVNGLPVGYFAGEDALTIGPGYGQVILADSDYSEVEGLSISGVGYAVQFHHCYRTSLADSEFDEVDTILFMSNSDDCSVSDVLATDTMGTALKLQYCTGASISNVTANQHSSPMETAVELMNCDTGLVLESSTFKGFHRGLFTWTTSDLIVLDCNFSDMDQGLYLSRSNDIEFHGCNITGIAGYGIRFDDCSLCVVANCSISRGSSSGIRLDSTDNTTIIYCEIFSNDDYAIDIRGSADNDIHHNNIANNAGALGQGFDDEGNNTWDDGISEGNWWSDWSGSGPYDIGGPGGAEDRYPLADKVNTSAPEEVPEASVLLAAGTILMVFFMADVRRRRAR